jgi:hypothetical protein
MIVSLVAGVALSPQATRGAEDLPSAAEAVSPVLVGTAVPDGSLSTATGESTTLGALRGGEPAVLIFYRGHW